MILKLDTVLAARLQTFLLSACVWASAVAGLLMNRPASAAYEVVTITDGGAIDGTVMLSGITPEPAILKVTKDQDYCGLTIRDPTYMVGNNGGLSGVVVYLRDIPKGKAPSSVPIDLVNEHCMFTPRAQGAMVRDLVKTSNNDMILHNTHPQNAETYATIYNIALPFKGFAVTKPLPGKPGLIEVKCDAHEWMRAWIVELGNPYFATTDSDGHFTIKDVPPGTYTLVAWHEAAGQKSEPVVVSAGQTAKPKITLAAK
jgi:Polysaccharide lyase family 4, domain II